MAGKSRVISCEKLFRGGVTVETEVPPWWCTKGCIHRINTSAIWKRKVLFLHVNSAWPFPKWRLMEGRNHFFRLGWIPSSLAPKWLVCQKAKHLQLEWIRLIKETLPSKRWEVRHLLGRDSSENGCLDFPGSVYDSCQAMLGLSNRPAGDHIIELILSINIDNNKGD